MELDGILHVNERITLVVPEGRNAGSYPSRVEDVGPSSVVVAAPTYRGAVMSLSEGDLIRIQVARSDAMYTLDTCVEALTVGPPPMLRLAMPVEIRRQQRRRYVRVDTVLRAWYRPTDSRVEPDHIPHRATATNVSGGGVLVAIRQSGSEVEPGAEIEVEILLPQGRVQAKGAVVRVSTESTETGVQRKIAVEFKDIDERQRDMLVRYVLQRQLELRRKGLL